MRRGRLGGLCSDCGLRSAAGLFWESVCIFLDFGVPEIPPLEPGDLGEPQRCDPCETRHRVRRAFADDVEMARRVYGAEGPEEALHLLGVEP